MTDTTFTLVRRALSPPIRRWSTRRHLEQQLQNPERLADVGLSQKQAAAEVRKPFWEC